MPKKLYIVDLTSEERQTLLDLVKKGNRSAYRIRRANTLLLASEARSDTEIAQALHIGRATVERTRKRFVEGGLDWALTDRMRPGGKVKLSGRDEALLVAVACSDAPEGRERWTMQLLADRLMELKVVESISDETVRRCLKKRNEALAEGRMVHSTGRQ
jgi:transposase